MVWLLTGEAKRKFVTSKMQINRRSKRRKEEREVIEADKEVQRIILEGRKEEEYQLLYYTKRGRVW